MLAVTIAAYFTVALTSLITLPTVLPTIVVGGSTIVLVALFTVALLVCGIACESVDSRRHGVITSVLARFVLVCAALAIFNTVYTRFGVGFNTTDVVSTAIFMLGIPAALFAIDEFFLPAVDAMFYEPQRVARRQRMQRAVATRSEHPMYVRRSIR